MFNISALCKEKVRFVQGLCQNELLYCKAGGVDMNDYIIETVNLTKKYNQHVSVDCLNLHVPKGKIYGLLGQNGAGKTTTMKMLLNLVKPTSGRVILFGGDSANSGQNVYYRIGSMIEAPGFYENLTAEENLKILASLRGQHRKDTIENALSIVGLTGRDGKSKLFREYSLGMKQRLGIAAAIMHEPEVLILDEPVNGLDPVGICDIREYLLSLCRERKTTILISSHILNEIEQMADVIGVMQEGKLIEEIDMGRLHRKNWKYVEFELSDVNAAALVLEHRFHMFDYNIIGNSVVRIFGAVDSRGAINNGFVENGITITNIHVCEEKLEDYFKKLIGTGGV